MPWPAGTEMKGRVGHQLHAQPPPWHKRRQMIPLPVVEQSTLRRWCIDSPHDQPVPWTCNAGDGLRLQRCSLLHPHPAQWLPDAPGPDQSIKTAGVREMGVHQSIKTAGYLREQTTTTTHVQHTQSLQCKVSVWSELQSVTGSGPNVVHTQRIHLGGQRKSGRHRVKW